MNGVFLQDCARSRQHSTSLAVEPTVRGLRGKKARIAEKVEHRVGSKVVEETKAVQDVTNEIEPTVSEETAVEAQVEERNDKA